MSDDSILDSLRSGSLPLPDADFSWSLPEGSSVDLTRLLSGWFPSGSLPAVTCSALSIDGNASAKSLDFSGELQSDWILAHVDGKAIEVTDMQLSLSRSESETSGAISGTWAIGAASLDTRYDFGDNRVFSATWSSDSGAVLGLNSFSTALGLQTRQLPAGLDINLKKLGLEYDRGANQFALKAEAGSGHAFLVASEGDAGWSIAWGVAIDLSERSSGALGKILAAVGDLGFKSVSAVYASAEGDAFSLDDYLNDPDFPLLGSTSIDLAEGLNLKAEIEFATTGNELAKALGGVLGGDSLIVDISLETPVSITANLGTPDISLLKAMRLTEAELTLTLGSHPSCELRGGMLIPLGGGTTQLTASLGVTVEEIEVALEWTDNDGGLKAPFLLKGVTLTELGAEFGVSFEDPGLVVGLEGQFDIVGEKGSNDCAIVVDFGAELIAPLAFKADVGELSIEVIVAAITGSRPSLPAPLSSLSVTDASFHWAQADTMLPDGSTVSTGFGFQGFVDLFGFKFFAMLGVSTDHLSGEFAMDPWPAPKSGLYKILRFSGDGEGVKKGQQMLVSPGGPNFAVSTANEPHLHASINVWLLGAELDALIEITDEQVEFDVTVDIGSAAHAEISCTISNEVFAAAADFKLDIDEHIDIQIGDLDLFSLHLVCELDGALAIHYGGSDFSMSVTGGFQFEGVGFQLPELKLDADVDITNLAGSIVQHIKDEAEIIFKDLAGAAEEIWDGAKQAAEEIAAGAENTAKAIATEAKAAAAEAEKLAKQISTDAKTLEKQAEALVADGKNALSDAASEVKNIAGTAAADVKKLGVAATKLAQNAEKTVAKIATDVAGDVKVLEAEGAKVVAEAKAFAENLESKAETAAKNLENAAEKAANEIVNDAKKVASDIEKEANKILDGIADEAKKVTHAVSHFFKKLF